MKGIVPEAMIIKPEDYPSHPVVGRYFAGHNDGQTQIYFCSSYDTSIGYWLDNVNDPADRRNVSDRAIDRTYHRAIEHEDHWYVQRWAVRVQKPTKEPEHEMQKV